MGLLAQLIGGTRHTAINDVIAWSALAHSQILRRRSLGW